MRQTKRVRLERKGWKIGSAQELLQLSDEETAYIELKLALSDRLQVAPREEGHYPGRNGKDDQFEPIPSSKDGVR